MHEKISIIIKTFERSDSLIRLLRSISDRKLTCEILIADDSKITSEAKIRKLFPHLSIKWFSMPFYTGLSVGRNKLISEVRTPYFLLCDDDFVLDERADINRALTTAIEGNYDIIGGDFYNFVTINSLRTFLRLLLKKPGDLKRFLLKQSKTSRYIGVFYIKEPSTCELRVTNIAPDQSPFQCDLVNNFFIGRTDKIKNAGGWDPELKLGEHEDFFLRMKYAGLKVAYLSGFGTRHYPVIKSNYKTYRLKAAEFKNRFISKHGFKVYKEVLIETGETLFEKRD
jgi:glycosyltransferase involved in cell wall biosynthesis